MQGLMIVSVVLAALMAVTSAHNWELGSCKNIAGIQDFKPEEFGKLWYVIDVSSTTSNCFSLYFNVVPQGFVVQESQDLHLGRRFGATIRMRALVNYTILEGSTMWATGQTNIPFFDGATATILDTDYTNYAIMYECQQWFIVRRVETAILSRTPTLSQDLIDQLLKNVAAAGINIGKLDKVDQENCSNDPDFSFRIDDIPGIFGNGEDQDTSFKGADGGNGGTELTEFDINDANPGENEVS